MIVSITGATGLIGQRLHQYLLLRGDTVLPITREVINAPRDKAIMRILDQSDIVVNLAGESIDQRWSPSAKLRILESRVYTTRRLVAAINRSEGSMHLISASAVGIYPSGGCYADNSRLRGNSFLADLCHAWEGETKPLYPHHALTITRFGVVFAKDGGAYPKLTALSRFGIMPRVGSAAKHLSWVDREDLVRALLYIFEHDDLRGGVVNITAPELTTQALLLKAINAPITLPISEQILRLTQGEAADLVLQNCCTLPERLLNSGFKFSSPTISDFVKSMRR